MSHEGDMTLPSYEITAKAEKWHAGVCGLSDEVSRRSSSSGAKGMSPPPGPGHTSGVTAQGRSFGKPFEAGRVKRELIRRRNLKGHPEKRLCFCSWRVCLIRRDINFPAE